MPQGHLCAGKFASDLFAVSRHLIICNKQCLCNLTLLQVLHAHKVRGADMGGSSDPVCKVSFGPFKARTRTVKKTLDPEWNETFIFVLEPDALALMGGVPMISFEVWDHNNFAPNYFLGEVFLSFLLLQHATSPAALHINNITLVAQNSAPSSNRNPFDRVQYL